MTKAYELQNGTEAVASPVTVNLSPTTPTITWANPAAIAYGVALGPLQLNATASVPGTFNYMPGVGTILNAGAGQTLSVTFTPTDTFTVSRWEGMKPSPSGETFRYTCWRDRISYGFAHAV